MKELLRVIKTLFAYLLRPDLYPELARKTKKNLFQRNLATKGQDKALEWLNSKKISNEEFFKNYLNLENPKPFKDLFPKDYKYGIEQQENCPVKMGGAGDLDLIYYLCEACNAKNVVETGVAYGWSSMAVLESLQKRNGTLYSSDMPYLAQNGDKYVGCVVPEHLRKNWKLFRYADKESLPKIFNECSSFDFVHYDSDKSYNGMKWAYEQLYPKVNKGGYFLSDDINDNSAFMDFTLENNLDPIIISYDDKFIGIIHKK